MSIGLNSALGAAIMDCLLDTPDNLTASENQSNGDQSKSDGDQSKSDGDQSKSDKGESKSSSASEQICEKSIYQKTEERLGRLCELESTLHLPSTRSLQARLMPICAGTLAVQSADLAIDYAEAPCAEMLMACTKSFECIPAMIKSSVEIQNLPNSSKGKKELTQLALIKFAEQVSAAAFDLAVSISKCEGIEFPAHLSAKSDD